MKKPTAFKTVAGPYGSTARVPRYNTDTAFHHEMEAWANSKSRFTVKVELYCEADNSSDLEFHELTRMKELVEYSCPYSSEVYSVEIDTGKFDADIFSRHIPNYNSDVGASLAECKRAIEAWCGEGCKLKYIKQAQN